MTFGKKLLIFSVIMVFIFYLSSMAGIIKGRVFDKLSKEPMIGVNILLQGTELGCASDIDGYFIIKKIPSGTYDLAFRFIGYKDYIIKNIHIKDSGEIFDFTIYLEEESIKGEEVVIEATVLQNSDAGVVFDRKNSLRFDDAVSSETMARTCSGNAASAVEKITGVLTEDSKYVYIRGVGGRYCIASLNGIKLPSADPDKNSVNFDLFPSDFIDNIKAIKTVTPDLPGDFAAGQIDITSKKFPETMVVRFASSVKYNSVLYGAKDFLSVKNEKLNLTGDFSGIKVLPKELQSLTSFPQIGYAYTDKDIALKLDKVSHILSSPMFLNSTSAPIQFSNSFTVGNKLNLGKKKLGFLLGINYSRNASFYRHGKTGSYVLTGNREHTNSLTKNYLFDDTKSTENVELGTVGNFALNFSGTGQIAYNFMYNRNASLLSRYQKGEYPEDLQTGIFETRTIKYQKREILSHILSGEHFLKSLRKSRLDWKIAFNSSTNNEPDTRFFSNDFVIRDKDTVFFIHPSLYPYPTHYFRNMKEDFISGKLDFKIPDVFYNLDVKFGLNLSRRNRKFREQRYEVRQDCIRYNGNPDEFFSHSNMGILYDKSTDNFFRFGNYLVDNTQKSSSYNGKEIINAMYFLVNGNILHNMSLITGVRFERTNTEVVSLDTLKEKGEISQKDFLPSLSLVYNLNNTMKLKFATSRTIARPNMRELSPYASFDFVGDYIFIGNPELDRTLIYNYDLRFESFFPAGEFLSLSLYNKKFMNPIEKVILNINGQVQYKNVDNAGVWGIEFEFRKSLKFFVDNLYISGNFTLISSRVKIPDEEYLIIKATDKNALRYRPLQGQAPYIINLDLSYSSRKENFVFGIHYYMTGKKLSEISMGGTPDIFEEPFERLDASFSKKIFRNLKIKLAFGNILNSRKSKIYDFKGKKYIYRKYGIGRNISFALSYEVK